jgi:hypothetical protein
MENLYRSQLALPMGLQTALLVLLAFTSLQCNTVFPTYCNSFTLLSHANLAHVHHLDTPEIDTAFKTRLKSV